MEKIDPWSSKGIKDYNKLMKGFGIERISDKHKKILNHHYFRRNIVFGHKDIGKILDAIKEKKPFVMMTGLMPSGKMHLGHKTVVDLIIFFQSLGAECYVLAADIEAYLTRNVKKENIRDVAENEYLLNYVALGLKPKKTKFYYQSTGSKEFMNLSKYAAKKITFNELKAIYGELTPGKIISALTQVADILHPQLEENGGPKPVVVPVGADQLPHINLTRDIAARMKSEYNFVLPSATFNKMLPGLKGGKMSSSDKDSYITFSESPKEVERKVKKYAFSGGKDTIKEHRKSGGNPDVDISYQWLTFFEKDDKKVNKIYEDYKSGALLSGEIKQILIDKLNKFLKEHNNKREKAKKVIDKFILKD